VLSQPDKSGKYNISINESVPVVVIGDKNTVIVNGQQKTIPSLAPLKPHYALVGRDALLQKLKKQLFANDSLALSAINGLPGVGKTALAVELANDQEVISHFNDGVLWAGLGPDANPFRCLGEWLLVLGIHYSEIRETKTLEERMRRVRGLLGNCRMLIVIDDAWKTEDALRLKVGGRQCAHILTTRQPHIALDFAGKRGKMVIEELSIEDGLSLLKQFAEDVVLNELEDATKIVKAVGGLPLALILIGRYLEKESEHGKTRRLHHAMEKLEFFEERLQIAQPPVSIEHHPGLKKPSISLHAVISMTDEVLNDDAKFALRCLAVFPPKPLTFNENAAVAVTTKSIETIVLLCNYGLVEDVGKNRYTIHQTISDYAKMKLKEMREENQKANIRHSRYYAELLREGQKKCDKKNFQEFVSIIERDIENVRLASIRKDKIILSTLSEMIGISYSKVYLNPSFSRINTYLRLIRIITQEGIKRIRQTFIKNSALQESNDEKNISFLGTKIAIIIGFPSFEVFLFSIAAKDKTERFRQKALDSLVNVYDQATINEQKIILEKSFLFGAAQSDIQTLYLFVYFMLRVYMQSYKNPEITEKMMGLISKLIQGFGRRPLIIAGQYAVRIILNKISNRNPDIYEIFFKLDNRQAHLGQLLNFVKLVDENAQPKMHDIRRLEKFILTVSNSDSPGRFVYFFFATRILFFCGVKDFSLVKESLEHLYDELPYTVRDLITGVTGLIDKACPSEDTLRLLEKISWMLIEKDQQYLMKGSNDENNMYYPLTPVGIAIANRHQEQPEQINFFVQAIEKALKERNWKLLSHYLRELGGIGNVHPQSVLLTLELVKSYINIEIKDSFIQSLSLINIRHHDLVNQFLHEQLDDDNPYTSEIRSGVLSFEDDGKLQRVVDSSVLYSFFSLMSINSRQLRSYLIDISNHIYDFDEFYKFVGYSLSKLLDMLISPNEVYQN